MTQQNEKICGMIDYYEFLQISPHAETETVHRVYRYLAGRFHPDNPESGDANLFCLVKAAYDVLSDPVKRAEYDTTRRNPALEADPFCSSVDFMDDLEGELNRRLAVLAVLYRQRRTNPDGPEVALVEIESRMGFPRDYLEFTLWYLVKKRYITRTDNAQFTLTADGVDFVETQRGSIPVLNKMLTTGSGFPTPVTVEKPDVKDISEGVRKPKPVSARVSQSRSGQTPIILPSELEPTSEWHPGMPDRRRNKVDRRENTPKGRRSSD